MIRHSHIESSFSLLSPPPVAFYQEFRPSADLRDFVACLWIRVVRGAAALAPAPIIPDGCADIMVYDDEPPFVVGPDTVTRWTSLREGLVITGLRLRPGAVRAVLKCPCNLLVNESAGLVDLVRGAKHLHRDLTATDNIRIRHALLEDWVRNALSENRSDDRAILTACRILTANTQKDIDALAFDLGWSARTLHRRFVAACGYGPKHFQRIMRLLTALRFMHGLSERTLVEAALEAGFADQAHMTRDFRAITGFTPSSYLALTTPEFGAWIGDD
jgi:AraC-like DNA-binding protein